MPQKTALVFGAGGFIGSHMVRRLKSEGYWVRGVDLKHPDFSETLADEFIERDLSVYENVEKVIQFKGYQGNFYNEIPYKLITGFDEIYQFAADMGGAVFVFTGENDADIMHNSATINLNVLDSQREINETHGINKTKLFYSGSACMYPEHNQMDPENPNCEESSAYPANPDSEYGWEKLFSERLFLAYHRNYNLNIRIGRFHNVFGPMGTWKGGKEKSPAAMCRKVSECEDNGSIEVWGDGQQTRSFLFIDECLEAVERLMNSDFMEPVNIGSEEMVTINQLAQMTIDLSQKNVKIDNLYGEEFLNKYGFKCPLGVKGRKSDNKLFREKIGWEPFKLLIDGLKETYNWVDHQVKNNTN
mgnify:CR=1 FL=1